MAALFWRTSAKSVGGWGSGRLRSWPLSEKSSYHYESRLETLNFEYISIIA